MPGHPFYSLLLILAGLLTGFVDSIAGGGGLISLPSLTLALGPGPLAIGTNKIVGTTGALVALLVYMRGGHLDWRRSVAFACWVGLGSLLGSRVAPFVPLALFKWALLITCPFILWIVWRKDLWIQKNVKEIPLAEKKNGKDKRSSFLEPSLLLSGLACGFYDGIWGPGGGTFMFLSLLFVARMPLLTAIASSKFANVCSALVSLVSYAQAGYVQALPGLAVASGVTLGAFLGARYARHHAARIVRPVLAFVVSLLLVRLLVAAP